MVYSMYVGKYDTMTVGHSKNIYSNLGMHKKDIKCMTFSAAIDAL